MSEALKIKASDKSCFCMRIIMIFLMLTFYWVMSYKYVRYCVRRRYKWAFLQCLDMPGVEMKSVVSVLGIRLTSVAAVSMNNGAESR